MFMAVTMESATFMGKNFQDNQNSIVNTADLTLRQLFGISAACLILAISVLQFALLQWRSELNKNQEKNESQQNQDL